MTSVMMSQARRLSNTVNESLSAMVTGITSMSAHLLLSPEQREAIKKKQELRERSNSRKRWVMVGVVGGFIAAEMQMKHENARTCFVDS